MAKKVRKNTAVIWTVNGDGANAGRQVREVLKASATLHERLHIAARSAMLQVLCHKQSTPLVDLLTGLKGTGWHVRGLKDWAVKYGRDITIGLTDNKITIKYGEDFEVSSLEDALAWAMSVEPFWVENPPPTMFNGFDYDAELKRLNDKAAKMAEALASGILIQGKGEITLSPKQLEMIKLGSYNSPKSRATRAIERIS